MTKQIQMGLSIAVATLLYTSANAETESLGKVSVTATKTLQLTSESPASVEIVNEEKIENKSVQRVDKALDDLAGVYVRSDNDNTPNSWGNSVMLRGIPQYYRTAVLVDGVALNNSFSGGVNWSNIAMDDIEQIEVVKGPFSSLYGGNAMSGVINVITKKPEKTETSVRLGLGSNAYKNISLVHRNRVSDALGVTINYDNKFSDGYIQDQVVKTPKTGTSGTTAVTGAIPTTTSTGSEAFILGDKGRKSWKQQNFGAKLYYDIDDNQQINIGYTYHKHETEFNSFNSYLKDASGNIVSSGSVQLDADSYLSLSESSFLFGPNGEDTSKYSAGYSNYLTGKMSLKINTGYNDYRYWYISTGSTAKSGAGKYTDIPNEKLYASLQMDFDLLESNYLVVGIDYTNDRLHKKVNTLDNWRDEDSKSTLRYKSEGYNTTQAIFIQDTINITDELCAYVGGRYDWWETDGSVDDAEHSYKASYDRRTQSQFSPKVSLVYLPTKTTTFRASAGSAFRAPSLSDLYSSYESSGVLHQADPNIKPESVTSWEIGFEHTFPTGTYIKSTYYENYLTNLIYTTTVNSALTEKRNAGKAEIRGIEVEVVQAILEDTRVFANYTYNTSEITENDSNPDIIGNEITYSPETTWNIGIDTKMGPVSGSVVGKYVSDFTTKDDNSDTIRDVYGTYEEHFTVDASIGYQINDSLKASVAVNNMLDAEYYQNNLVPGRTFYAELLLKF